MAISPLNYKASQYHSTWGRLKCLSRQSSTFPLGTALALQQLFSFSLLLHQFGCTAHFLYSFTQSDSHSIQVFFFPHKHGTKVILDAEGKSANSSMHSQGMPGSTHRPVLFKAAPVGLWALSPAVYHIRVLYLIRAANNISTASPQEEESENTPLPLAPC